jgi:hypothetical protein
VAEAVLQHHASVLLSHGSNKGRIDIGRPENVAIIERNEPYTFSIPHECKL